jgi:hypothetical protein
MSARKYKSVHCLRTACRNHTRADDRPYITAYKLSDVFMWNLYFESFDHYILTLMYVDTPVDKRGSTRVALTAVILAQYVCDSWWSDARLGNRLLECHITSIGHLICRSCWKLMWTYWLTITCKNHTIKQSYNWMWSNDSCSVLYVWREPLNM